jgi:flagellar hook protein FlgE
MSFQQGLSGLNAAARNLDVIGNNVANANTVGAKASRAEFADIYANSLNGSTSGTTGIGVSVSSVAQQFTQGDIVSTQNPLDMAINGRGFFRTSNDGSVEYTRNGQFRMDKDGYVVEDRIYNRTCRSDSL